MKKRSLLIIIIVLSMIILFLLQIDNKPSLASTTQTYTKKQMQNFVVSTAVSYLNNKSYSEYDQKAMDSVGKGNLNVSTVLWRNYNISPEMPSRSNYYHIDCSSFATIVYMYSLGYDFSEYYEKAEKSIYTFSNDTSKFNGTKISKGKEYFEEAYKYHGKATSTEFFAKIGASKLSSNKNKFKNTSESNKNIVVYHYEFKSNSNKSDILDEVEKLLQKGDIVVYRRYKDTSKTDQSGHAMVYVGDTIHTDKGFIHSTGSDYIVDGNTLEQIGDDGHSVRYDGMYKLRNSVNSSSKPIKSITVIRPINKFCDKDTCSITIKDTSTSMMKESFSNKMGRVDLSGLRIEQYVRSYNPTLNKNLTNSIEENLWSTSKYNSVNVGDTLQYSLYLKNNSQIKFCSGSKNGNDGGKYANEKECTNAKLTWKTSTSKEKKFTNIVVTAKVPNNTEYKSCTHNCKYDSKTKTITWKINDTGNEYTTPGLENGDYKTLRYEVIVIKENQIENNGITIKSSNGNKIKMPTITTKVNPTMTKINAETIKTNINNFKKAVSNGKIKYNSESDSEAHKINLNNPTKVQMSSYGFIKTIYYNAFDIDLSYLNGTNIKNAIFNSDNSSNFAKKTNKQIENLTGNKQNINKMLVKGFYGGRYLHGNDNKDRPGRLRITDLEFGDIIIYFANKDGKIAGTSVPLIYLGTNQNENSSLTENQLNSYFARFTTDNKVTLYTMNSSKTSYQLFYELWSKDLFVVLRPFQLYGTTVNYKNATINDENSSVEYKKYRNLKNPTSYDKYTLTLKYNKDNYSCSECKTSYNGNKNFEGWYSDSKFTNKISNNTTLLSTSSHTIYAKWNYTTITLPNATSKGYTIEGWYSDKQLTKKVSDAGKTYKITSNKTLYAKWTANEYKISYNSNGGSGTMNPSTHKYNEQSSLSLNRFTKEGYIFIGWSKTKTGNVEYQDGQNIENLTLNNETITLYAIWKKADSTDATVQIIVKNGTSNVAKKVVKKGENVTFEVKSNPGYSSYKLSCSNSKLNGTTLTITNINSNITCEVTFDANKYTITYNANGGTGTMKKSTHVYSQSSELSINTFERKGYKFVGWSKTENGKIEFVDKENILNLTTKTENINLYAIWKEEIYKISYELNGGTLDEKITTYTITSENITLGIPKKEGYLFAGWTTNNSTTPNKTIVIPKGTTGNKKYIANYITGKYKISYFSDQNGTITGIKEETLAYKKSPSGTTKTIKDGYKELKWAVDKDVELISGKKILSGDPITQDEIKKIIVKEDIKITAYHYKKKYTISYKSNQNGQIVGISSEDVSELSQLLGTKTKPSLGYIFAYWTANIDVKVKQGTQISNLVPNNSITLLSANIKSQDINLLNNKLAYGETIIKKGQPIYDATQIIATENIVLTANYKKDSFKVKYQSDENGIITGKEEETKMFEETISGTTTKKINDNYEFNYWTANIDVKLNDNTVKEEGTPISNEELSQIIATENIILTAHYKQIIFNVYYKNSEGIIIINNAKEEVRDAKELKGPELTQTKQDKILVFISDKNIDFTNGKTIKAGDAIARNELNNIALTEDITLTVVYKDSLSKILDLSNINIDTVLFIVLIIILFSFILYLIKNRKVVFK